MHRHRNMILNSYISSVFYLLAACATTERESEKAFNTAVTETSSGFRDAALSPLEDFNLKRTPIPKRLKELESPYVPTAKACSAIAKEVIALTTIVGPDADQMVDEEGKIVDRIGDAAGEEAAGLTLDTVEDTATSFIPFRSLVRRATGATAHERKVLKAYQKGLQRRSYLKGLGHQLGCAPPAAPYPIKPAEPNIEYRGALSTDAYGRPSC